MQTHNKKFKNFRFWHICDPQRMASMSEKQTLTSVILKTADPTKRSLALSMS